MRAQAIVLPLPARSGGAIFGKTVETVLAERPCRVVLLADPEIRSPDGGRPQPAVPGADRGVASGS
jgi:hypothetical protein